MTDKLLIPDLDTIRELTTFIKKGNSYAAEPGHHDDLAMTLVLFGWMSTQDYFKNLVSGNLRETLYSEQIKDLEEGLTPFGMIDDGLSNDFEIDDEGNLWRNL